MKRYISQSFFAYICFVFLFFLFFLPKTTLASSLSLSPNSGNFSVGDTFNVSVLLDTQGKSVNALQVFLSFPPDKLQVISPSAGPSIIGVWTVPPKFNNVDGTIDLEGGIPNGMITSKGILTTLTFRVSSVGDAILRFMDGSKIFLNDGLATPDLSQTTDAEYELKLPPPEGPIVTSSTDPNQSIWYSNPDVTLNFGGAASDIESFSYVLNNAPITTPNNIGEGTRSLVSYNNLSDGIYYFHIKALRDGVWGGTTNYAIKIDTTPPALFPIEILPGSRTTSTQPVIQFSTTDSSSGLDHYEIKMEPVSSDAVLAAGATSSNDKSFFIEATSPFITPVLALGSYDVFVRAYDQAGNYREVTQRLVIVSPLFKFIGDNGIIINGSFVVSWLLVWFIGFILLLVLIFLAFKAYNWRQQIIILHKEKKLPENIQSKLEELKKYKEKYGTKLIVALFCLLSMMSSHSVHAQNVELSAPIITELSKDISNTDIFYVGGKADSANETIIIYLENNETGETLSENTITDQNGNWFYRHDTFLSPGDYLLWAQTKDGEDMSPPTPEVTMTVKKTAIQFGANRLSYETIYLLFVLVLLLGIIGLILFILFHLHNGRKKHKEFKEEIKKMEDYVNVHFAILQRDLAEELALLHKTTLPENFSEEEKRKEAQLIADLNDISKNISKNLQSIDRIEEKND